MDSQCNSLATAIEITHAYFTGQFDMHPWPKYCFTTASLKVVLKVNIDRKLCSLRSKLYHALCVKRGKKFVMELCHGANGLTVLLKPWTPFGQDSSPEEDAYIWTNDSLHIQ